MIPFLNVADLNRSLERELEAASRRVVSSGVFVLGPELDAFESELAEVEGVAHAIGVASGLDALTLSLKALGVGPGDEVIVPSHTFIATWLSVTSSGAAIVPVDVSDETYNLDPDQLADAVTSRTAAIVPVHLYGSPAPMEQINKVAKRYGLAVVADGAQSIGATLKGIPVAKFANATTLSFYPAKNLGALGDGGAILTDDANLAHELKRQRNYGSTRKYVHEIKGANSRLDEIQAAYLRVKLPLLADWNRRRSTIAGAYLEGLAGTSLSLPKWQSESEPVWHLFVVRSQGRDDLQASLSRVGVQTLIHYPIPPQRQEAYQDLAVPSSPIADRIAAEVLSLPMCPTLTDAQVLDVVQRIVEIDAQWS